MKTNTLLLTLIAGSLCQLTAEPGRTQAAPTAAEIVPSQARRGPREIVAETLRNELGRKLKEAGAAYDDLQVTVAQERDDATPFRITYRGLKNFKGSDGTSPDADGAFVMQYIGGGQWQGSLSGMPFTVPVGRTDNIDLPFVDDPPVVGEWESVDFVADISDFTPARQSWGGDLYLKSLTFRENGKTAMPWFTWTKGMVMHHGDKTASRYELKEINGASYLFFEWKSGDVTISGMKPRYYVLKKKAAQ